MAPLTPGEFEAFARAALAEDIGSGDVTSLAVIDDGVETSAEMKAREPLRLAGLDVAVAVFQGLGNHLRIERKSRDGDCIAAGACLAVVHGPARSLLTAERTALNCVQRLSGIATLTAAFVEAVAGSHARILDTRKTTPGWRRLEKYAVTCGGGTNHRQRLDDLVLIKDNHLAALREARPNPIAAAVVRARHCRPYLKVEVEVETLEQVRQALEAGADILLLDNMRLEELRQAADLCQGRAQTEASGGVRLEAVREIAATGVDFISVGALTHGARWMDIGLDFTP